MKDQNPLSQIETEYQHMMKRIDRFTHLAFSRFDQQTNNKPVKKKRRLTKNKAN